MLEKCEMAEGCLMPFLVNSYLIREIGIRRASVYQAIADVCWEKGSEEWFRCTREEVEAKINYGEGLQEQMDWLSRNGFIDYEEDGKGWKMRINMGSEVWR